MITRAKLAGPFAAAALAWGGAVQPVQALLTKVFDDGLIHTTDALDANFIATGSSMAGIRVTVTFDDDSTEVATWEALSPAPPLAPNPGGAFGGAWSLVVNENTYPVAPSTPGSAWVFANDTGKVVRSILIDGAPGDHVFDTRGRNGEFTLVPPNFGTAGSADGWDFDIDSNSNLGLFQVVEILPGLFINVPLDLDVTATYRDAVALTGQAPVGDLFRLLEVTFADPITGQPSGLPDHSVLSFFADTDKLEFPLVPIPTPGAALLALIGIGATCRRRRFRSAAG